MCELEISSQTSYYYAHRFSIIHINILLFVTFMLTQCVYYARDQVAFAGIPRAFVAVEKHLHNRTANREVPTPTLTSLPLSRPVIVFLS